ncbi:MAG TPA: hypothetical protein VK338_06590, partial [Candidatus Nitrosocosmicus sp.]|nr:hypothetical protein [Candidatus Nitrosocosmicus sp.]
MAPAVFYGIISCIAFENSPHSYISTPKHITKRSKAMQANTGTAEVVNPIIMSEEPGQQLEIPREKIQVNGRQMKPDTTMEMLLINL